MSIRFIFGLLLVVFLTSCSRNELDIDVSGVDISPLKALRLEESMFSVTEQNFKAKHAEIKSQYGLFYEHYIMNLMRINGTQDSLYKKNLFGFIQDRDIKGSYLCSKTIFTNTFIQQTEEELNNCVRRFHYHFPSRKLPQRFVTCLSGWNYAFAYTDSTLVTSLDMYLGDTSVYYKMLQLPQYRTRFMKKEYLLSDMMRGWMISEFDNSNPVNNLLHHTIFYGKMYYAVNALLPDIQDSTLMCYTDKQMEYCKKYEKKLWGYFAEKNRLYESNMKNVQELTTDGPFTGSISKECPPRIAMWVGLQIIRSYMKNNKDAKLEEVMLERDAQKILAKSKYRP